MLSIPPSASATLSALVLSAVSLAATPARADTDPQTCTSLEEAFSQRGWLGGNGAAAVPEAEAAMRTCQDAMAGDAEAQTALGVIYWENILIPDDDAKALSWFRAAADQGDVLAMSYLGLAYGRGRGVERDYDEAVRYHEIAVAAGIPQSMGAYADYVRLGIGPVQADRERGVALTREAAEAGDGYAAYWIGLWEQSSNIPTFRDWMLRSAQAGEPLGMYAVAVAHRQGSWMPQDDQRYIKLITLAATRGHRTSQETIAAHYRNGTMGLPKDPDIAEFWYREAAEKGSTFAQEELANRDQWDAPPAAGTREVTGGDVWIGLLFLTIASGILIEMGSDNSEGSNQNSGLGDYGPRDTPWRDVCGLMTPMEQAMGGC